MVVVGYCCWSLLVTVGYCWLLLIVVGCYYCLFIVCYRMFLFGCSFSAMTTMTVITMTAPMTLIMTTRTHTRCSHFILLLFLIILISDVVAAFAVAAGVVVVVVVIVVVVVVDVFW